MQMFDKNIPYRQLIGTFHTDICWEHSIETFDQQHDITEILLKVALNTTKQKKNKKPQNKRKVF
jgi:hypothetical protein